MDTTEASKLFKLDTKRISKLCSKGLIPGAMKLNGRWILPDDLKLIMDKNECSSVLIEILKKRNYGNSYPVNRKLFQDDEKLSIVMDYLYRLGFVGEYNREEKIEIENIQLTEDGFKIALGRSKSDSDIDIQLHFSIEIPVQIGAINVKL